MDVIKKMKNNIASMAVISAPVTKSCVISNARTNVPARYLRKH